MRAILRGVPTAVIVAVAGAWAVAITANAAGVTALARHDRLIEGGLGSWGVLGAFLVAWQLMLAATMLPSSFPMMRLFAQASSGQERPGLALAAFLAGYGLVWTSFGALAFGVDVFLHRLVDASPWLVARTWLLAAGVLALAGAFQFSGLMRRCLDTCRHPAAYLLRHYRRGIGEAFWLGWGHGLFCLGCCWALMLAMFAAGLANLAWMAILVAVMAYEKAGRGGRQLATGVGVALLVWSALVLAHPPWLPGALARLA